MIFKIDKIKELVKQIVMKYRVNSLQIFGSYACSEATDDCDLDILLDYIDTIVFICFDFIDIGTELELVFDKKVDITTVKAIYNHPTVEYFSEFMNFMLNERVLIYRKEQYKILMSIIYL